jgi:enoyl-CoA hydratase/carnithine racemase
LADAANTADIGCIVLAGAGERAFSAGYDVRELAEEPPSEFLADNLQRYEWMWRIAEYPKPVIVANHGIAMGAGAIIAVSADIRIGCEQTIFKFSSTPHGMAMLTWNLPPLVGWSKAKEYLMTSCKIGSEEALRSGLLNRVVAKAAVLPAAIEMAQTIASYPASGPQNIKRLMREGLAETQRGRFEKELAVTLNQLQGQPNNVGEMFADLINKEKK